MQPWEKREATPAGLAKKVRNGYGDLHVADWRL
jgi:hypothetical protein